MHVSSDLIHYILMDIVNCQSFSILGLHSELNMDLRGREGKEGNHKSTVSEIPALPFG